MKDLLESFALTFVPLFVAMDAIGALPLIVPTLKGFETNQRKRIIRLAMTTALGLGLGFVAIGSGILYLLDIKVADFLVAGGLILFLYAGKELVGGKMMETSVAVDVGIVPIGTPLVVGPAVLATLLLLTPQYNVVIVIISFVLNLLITWLVFAQADRIIHVLGKGGVTAASKIVSLFLAAIAIKMIRQGVMGILNL